MKGLKLFFITCIHIWKLSALHWNDTKFFSYHTQSHYEILFINSILKLILFLPPYSREKSIPQVCCSVDYTVSSNTQTNFINAHVISICSFANIICQFIQSGKIYLGRIKSLQYLNVFFLFLNQHAVQPVLYLLVIST